MKSTALAELKATDQDFEWYPTTDEIITAFHRHANNFEPESLLDIGAGNGKVLNRFKELNRKKPDDRDYHTDYFAIEKARPLLDSLPIDVGILGTDFWEQSLLDKSVECIFSNPPYREFIDWSVKIIREANANHIYLVMPQRWKDQKKIMDAIESRRAGHEVIGEFDFLNSEDRTARAKVDLVHIWLCHDELNQKRYRYHKRVENIVDPFELWVKEFFDLSDKKNKSGLSDYEKSQKSEKVRKEKIGCSLVAGSTMIEVLDELYRQELDNLINNYRKVSSLDEELFEELDISTSSIIKSIRSRINGLKNAYWQELFDNYTPLTGRLTAASRKNFIESIRRKTSIDFTSSNAYAITVWAIKNADQYLNSQMIDTFNCLVDSASVINYKSNERVFKENNFRYRRSDEKHTHFKLDYRIVVSGQGTVSTGGYNSYLARGGLSENGANFIDDLIVIARNLGFDSQDSASAHNFVAGGKEEFYCTNKAGKHIKLMEVRAYMNGNMHIKFNQAFMLALNVEIGRLQGWIHNVQHAAQEMGEKAENIAEVYNTAFALSDHGEMVKMLTMKAA